MTKHDDQSEAFGLAEQARAAIERIVQQVTDAEIDLDGAFALADADALTGRVFALKVFEAVPGVGKVRARRTMTALGMDHEVTLSSLTADARCEIAKVFAGPADAQIRPQEPRRPLILVLSGPGGVGKGTVVQRLIQEVDRLWLSRSWTTRDRRPGEAADAYNFVDRQEFEAHIERGGFLEWVEFLDYLQGTPIPDPPAGHDVLLEIDVKGAAQVRAMDPDAILMFIDAPSAEEQERRLRARGDDDHRVAERLATAVIERKTAAELGCTMLINTEVESSVAELTALIAQLREAAERT